MGSGPHWPKFFANFCQNSNKTTFWCIPSPLAISGLKTPSLGHFWLRPYVFLCKEHKGHSMRNEQIFRKVVAEGSSNFLKKITLKGV